MAEGLGPKIPLSIDANDGIAMYKTVKGMVAFELKNLLLTSPGERVMLIDYGVGLFEMLFENVTDDIVSRISERIYKQTDKWMPFIEINEINFEFIEESNNLLFLEIFYVIKPLGVTDNLVVGEEDLGIR